MSNLLRNKDLSDGRVRQPSTTPDDEDAGDTGEDPSSNNQYLSDHKHDKLPEPQPSTVWESNRLLFLSPTNKNRTGRQQHHPKPHSHTIPYHFYYIKPIISCSCGYFPRPYFGLCTVGGSGWCFGRNLRSIMYQKGMTIDYLSLSADSMLRVWNGTRAVLPSERAFGLAVDLLFVGS